MSQKHKLEVLRAKTDRDLLLLVRRELERGLTLADVATTKRSPLYAQAERVYENVKAWLPRISGLEPQEQWELELRLRQLYAVLERLPSDRMQRHLAGASLE
jgi:hypothetical protein